MSSIKKSSEHKPAPVSPLYQIFFIILSATIIGICLYSNLNTFHMINDQPSIERITPAKFRELGSFPSFITTGLHINKFEIFDVIKNQFLIDGIVWFKYITGSVSLKTLELFSFNRGEIIKKSPPDVQIDGENCVVRYNIKVKFSSNINYRHFPLDNHRIYLCLTHEFIGPKEVQFLASSGIFTIENKAVEAGWQIVDKYVQTGFDQAQFDDSNSVKSQKKMYPVTLFSFDIKRAGMRHLITILLPLLIVFYISFFGLSVSSGSLKIGIMAVTAIISYRFVIENMSPPSSYFMISDYIFFLYLFAELSVFSLIIVKSYANILETSMTKFFIALIHTIVIGISSYILLAL